jgi:hypothetical protein
MSLRKALVLFLAVLFVGGTVTACSLLDTYKSSPQYARFCEWQPLASTAIQAAAQEALADVRKQKVGQSLSEAANFLQMMATGCPKPTEVKA